VIKTTETQSTFVPFYRVYTPYTLRYRSNAEFFETLSYTRTALTFSSGSQSYGRLFKLPLLPWGVFHLSDEITIKLTIGLDSGIRASDSDPKFIISNGQDGNFGLGFEMREEAIRCRGIEGTTGSTLQSRNTFPGAQHTSEVLPEQFTMILKPAERWGSCYHSADSGIISPVYFSRSLNPSHGLYLEVYREGPSENYTFNYIIVEIYEYN